MNPRARLERRLFLVLVALLLPTFAFLVGDRRMMRGHDHFFAYSLSWFGTCQSVGGGGATAYWIPYVAQGTEAGIGISGAAPLVPFWPGVGRFYEGIHVLSLHYAWLFLQELLFASGLWLLARRWFSDPRTVFFVAATATGSMLWIDQPIPFATVLPIPLLLLWGHEFLETGSRSRLLLSAALLALTAFGTYNVLLIALAVASYFAVHVFLFRGAWRAGLRPTDLLWLAAILGVLGLPWFVHDRSGELVGYSEGRGSGGAVGLDNFLTYGGYLNPLRFLELVAGVSPSLDAGVFAGAATTALAVGAVALRPRKAILPPLVVFFLALAFSTGFLGVVAVLSHAWVPKMTLFRHVAWGGAVARLFLIFLAGHGLEAVRRRRTSWLGWGTLGVAALVGGLAVLPAEEVLRVLETARRGFTLRHELAGGPWSAVFLLSTAAALGVTGALLLRGTMGARGIGLLLAVHVLHLAGWKLANLHLRTIRLTPEAWAMHEARPLPYVPRRTDDSPRRAAFAGLWPYGSENSGSDAFFIVDAPAPRGRHASWQRPLDRLIRAWAEPGRPIAAANRIRFPSGHAAIARVIGLSTDKLQVFRRAVRVSSDERIAALFREPAFKGDLLFIRGADDAAPDPAADDRMAARCDVAEFDANRLVVQVEGTEGAWLAYADVWHPRWTATVNGDAVNVERANLAYKAVALRSGPNRVEFRFEPGTRRRAVTFLMGVFSAGGLALLGWMVARAVSARKGL